VDDDPIGKNFLGADDDEIGAVFDQVLRTGPVVKDRLDEALASERSEDDRQSTRIIDAETISQLARDSGTSEPKLEPVPDGNWFVAINEKQTGPLSLEKLKEHWDRGEIGPDSLCWREGFSDWIPLSEVKALAVVLAPKPPKPIVVPTATIPNGGQAVMSVPVQSAFSAGGLMQTVQAEVQVPINASPSSSIADREESGAWKPSAASALASLVKDEMDALAKPPPKPAPAPLDDVPSRGLLDLPGQEEKPAPANPYLANPGATYSAPAITQYRPQSNRGLLIGLGIGAGVIVLLMIGLIVWVVGRQPAVVAQVPPAPQVAVQPPVTPPVAVVTPPVTPPPANPAVAANPTTPPVTPPVAVQPPVTPPPATNPAVAVREPVRNPVHQQPRTTEQPTRAPRETPAVADPPPVRETHKAPAGDDDFESAFGPSKTPKKEAPKQVDAEPKHSGGYVPPAPGSGGDLKESLVTSDILEVAVANQPALKKCAEEQKKRDPSTSGKLVMRWQIQTSGRVTNVSVVSDEFKGTYMAGCVGGLIKTWVFPKHKNQGEPITFPFKF
jgi:cytoskeletal protein RodZ